MSQVTSYLMKPFSELADLVLVICDLTGLLCPADLLPRVP